MQLKLRVQSEPLSALGELFETRVVPGRPSWKSVATSVVFHALATLCLALIRFPASPHPRVAAREYPPTEIKIGEKLYLVQRLATPERRSAAPSIQVPAPQRTAARKSAAGRSQDAPKQLAAIPEPAPPAPQRPTPRPFIPPEVKRNTKIEQTLIQPMSPQDIPVPELNIPSFRAWTSQIPKVARRFTAPGAQVKQPEATPLLTPPTLNLASANPAPPKTNPAITLPLPAPPIEVPETPANMLQAMPPGDPVNIIAITKNPVLPAASLVVPAGNVSGIAGKDAGAGLPGDTAAAAAGLSNGSGKAGTSPNAVSAAGSGKDAASAKTAGSAGANGPGSEAGAGPGSGPAAASGTGTSAGALSASSPGGANGAGAPSPAKPKTVVINRPSNGNFDAVIVQSSPLDILPGRKDLLSGRPIYTVYLSVGTSKDWTFFFCAPQDGRAKAPPSPVVNLAASPPPLTAPYPVRLVRPLVALPSYQKYVLIHGFVTDAGRVERLKIIDPGSAAVDDAVLSSLIDWEFRPAARDGQPTTVEFLLAIPQAGMGP